MIILIKDITIGQYFFGKSFIHKCDARTIAPFIDELIKNQLTDLKLADIVEETKEN